MPTQTPLPAHLIATTRPQTDPANLITGENWRISVLAHGVVRLQWSPSGRFEDRASQAVLYRDAPPVNFTTRESESVVEVITDRLHLTYDRGPFSAHGLSVQARGGISTYHSTWRYGGQGEGNLGGTARTLDHLDGRVPLEDGVLAIHGVAVYDDSHTVLFADDGWFGEREPGSIDLYVFCFGRDYRDGLRALYQLTGPAPLVPRWALGNWWSRYHPYSAGEYLQLMDRFAAERLPFSVAVIDMDWHLVDIDSVYGSGWTGYTWNRDLFADPEAFLAALHERGLRTTANVHPADGIRAHEEWYPQVAEAMGADPGEELPVSFDPTDPKFLRAYFELVHHPLEEQGVDFWWLDWQQGRQSRVAGLDPLWLLNHLHFLDSGRLGGPLGARPLTFSRYAGVGSHRYPVGFSGDAVTSWASLAFQSEFTARASNVGYGWWSHDVGGHWNGIKDAELATRWVQLGVFSPILRLHSTRDIFNSKEPWRYPRPAQDVMGRFLRLRHRLLPYLATMARRAHVEGIPLVSPMYHEHPWADEAYRVPNQVLFGSCLVVSPVVTPADRGTGLARTEVWLPAGEWVDLFTGVLYSGGRMVPMHRGLSSLPVLARAGTVLPMVPSGGVGNRTGAPDALEVWVVAGADGAFELAEDADDDAWAFTGLRYTHDGGRLELGPVIGHLQTVGPQREWSLVLVGFGALTDVRVDGETLATEPGPIPGSVRVGLGGHPSDQRLVVGLRPGAELTGADVRQALYALLDEAEIEFAAKNQVWQVVSGARSLPAAALAVQALGVRPELVSAVNELLLARP